MSPRVRLSFVSSLSIQRHVFFVHHGSAAPPLNRGVSCRMKTDYDDITN
jgi:hypothetical protein